MCAKAKSCIKKGNLISGYFPSNIDVRQGDNLSQLLLALLINEFKPYIGNTYLGLKIEVDFCYPSLNENSIHLIKLFALLYADYTIVFSENFKLRWTLYTVNINKSNIIVFSRGKVRRFPMFKYGDNTYEVVPEYIYLGENIMYSNKYAKAMKKTD